MGLSFLPDDVRQALSHLNYNNLTEIRLRKGQPVVAGYNGAYLYLGRYGVVERAQDAILCGDVTPVLNRATENSLYKYAEQIKSGFITCGHGIRIGLAGEYVTQNGKITTIGGLTSLNIRIPHEATGYAERLLRTIDFKKVQSLLVFSRAGYGKTTLLRDIVRGLNGTFAQNILLFDERGEISAMNAEGEGFDLGPKVDVVRSGDKLSAMESAIRAMKPDFIVTDELYGESDIKAVRFALACGIRVIASTHVTDKSALKGSPFELFAEIPRPCGQPVIYDKNFNTYCACGTDDGDRRFSFGGQEEKNADIP